MFKRLRQLNISLAAKCQLLFGAAVVLIIAAALFVPWYRMEQLTQQLNERAAGALAEHAVAQHVALYTTLASSDPAAARKSPGTAPVTIADKSPSPVLVGLGTATTRLVAADRRDAPEFPWEPGAPREPRRDPKDNPDLAKFELRALSHFKRHPETLFYAAYYDRGDGAYGYRYAKPLYVTQDVCMRCHAWNAPAGHGGGSGLEPTTTAAAATTTTAIAPASQPTALASLMPDVPALPVDPANRVGIVSVDFGSRIDANELLLNRVFFLLAGLLAGTLAIIVFYVITTRLILQPVRVLQETAEKVSQGDLNIRSDINTGDEFQQLSETFNVMLANLKQNADQLRAINKSLDLKLGQLAETNVALYESNRLKSEFLANVSHELRTPLNSILGFADLLKDAAVTGPAPGGDGKDGRDAKTVRYITNIVNSGQNLLDLINDLLDLAKIEAGRMEIRSEPLSVNDLFEGLTTIIKPLAEQKKVAIVSDVAPDVPILYGDPGKLQQVLYNFLSNAIKFSPEEGTIELTAAREGDDRVRIGVTDHGPGIHPEKHGVIFEKFRQLDASVTRTHGGTGLGLSISKELTQLMGGSIGLDSTPGTGSTFWIKLPLRIQSGQADMRGRLVLT